MSPSDKSSTEGSARRDLLICALVVGLLFALAVAFDLMDRWQILTREHRGWHLDELLSGFALAALAFSWFAYRRWREGRSETERGRTLGQRLRSEVTARREAERELRESDRRLAAATKSARLGYYVWDLVENRCLECSQEYARIHGMTVEEYLGDNAALEDDAALVHPHDRQRYLDACERLIATGEPMSLEYRLVAPDGTVRNIREIEYVSEVRDGKAIRSEGTVQDITELKRAESLLAQAMDASPSVYALYDPEDRLVISNGRFVLAEETRGTPMVQGARFEDLLRSFVDRVGVGKSREEGEAWIAKRLNRRRDPAVGLEYEFGRGEWVEVNDIVLEDGSVFSIARRITGRKKMEAELRQAQKMEAVGQLTGGLAHDFNNLLGVIRGQTEALADTLGAGDGPVSAILRATDRGSELTRRLLAVARKQPLEPRSLDIAELARGMGELLRRTLGEGLEIEIAAAPGLWPALADPGQVENALLNLAINARKAMPEGGRLTIEASNVRLEAVDLPEDAEARAGDYVLLAVSDTGEGMSAEVRARALEPFFTTHGPGEGSGLGLSMVYGFVKQSGGHLELYSEPGLGTTVQLYLPRAEAPEREPARTSHDTLPEGRGERVLVVEDEAVMRSVVTAMVERLGYRPQPVADAAEAVARISTGEPVEVAMIDLVLSGGVSGPDLAEELRRRAPELEVVFMSGYPLEAAVRHGLLEPGSPLLHKPFRRPQLAWALRQALARRECE